MYEIYTCLHTDTYVYIHIYMHTDTCIQTNIHIHVCNTYIHTHKTFVYIKALYTHMHIFIHTQTHVTSGELPGSSESLILLNFSLEGEGGTATEDTKGGRRRGAEARRGRKEGNQQE